MHDEAAGDIMMLWYYHVGVFEQPQLKVRIELEYHFNSTLHHRALAPGARHSGSKIPATVKRYCSCFAEFRVALCCSGFRVGSTLRLARMLLGAASLRVRVMHASLSLAVSALVGALSKLGGPPSSHCPGRAANHWQGGVSRCTWACQPGPAILVPTWHNPTLPYWYRPDFTIRSSVCQFPMRLKLGVRIRSARPSSPDYDGAGGCVSPAHI